MYTNTEDEHFIIDFLPVPYDVDDDDDDAGAGASGSDTNKSNSTTGKKTNCDRILGDGTDGGGSDKGEGKGDSSARSINSINSINRDSCMSTDSVIVASPCSGHGFKFASVIGEILSEMALEGHTDHDIGMFRLED